MHGHELGAVGKGGLDLDVVDHLGHPLHALGRSDDMGAGLHQIGDRAAVAGDPTIVRFPRALRDRPYDFSFSGLKTSVVTFLEKAKASDTVPPLPDVAAAVQEAIVDVLVDKTFNAVEATGVE